MVPRAAVGSASMLRQGLDRNWSCSVVTWCPNSLRLLVMVALWDWMCGASRCLLSDNLFLRLDHLVRETQYSAGTVGVVPVGCGFKLMSGYG